MDKSIYKSTGKTPKEAFENIWQLIQFTDDFCLRKEDDVYVIRLVVQIPNQTERHEFEVLKK